MDSKKTSEKIKKADKYRVSPLFHVILVAITSITLVVILNRATKEVKIKDTYPSFTSLTPQKKN